MADSDTRKKASSMLLNTKRNMGGNIKDKYCYICRKVVSCNNMKDHQIKEHSEDIENIKKSKDTKDYVRSACKVCGAHKKLLDMRLI